MKLTLRQRQTAFWNNKINPITGWDESRKQEDYRFKTEQKLIKERAIVKRDRLAKYKD